VWQTPHPLFVEGAHDSVEKSCAVPAIWEKPGFAIAVNSNKIIACLKLFIAVENKWMNM
jgi:hypothetical protein